MPRPRSAKGADPSRDFGRANDPPLLILTSLASGPKHGYALTQDIESFAGVTLGPGSLYGALTRLEERGLIAALEADDRRRPYRLTSSGHEALTAAVADLSLVAEEARSRMATAANGSLGSASTLRGEPA